MDLKNKIRVIPDFPEPGIRFKDITTLLQDGESFKYAIDKMAEFARNQNAEIVAGPEARGFVLAAPLAYAMGLGFVPIRKAGKLPGDTVSVSYELEYGKDMLEIHRDAIKPGQRVIIADDLLATGGTIKSTVRLVEELGGVVAGITFMIELSYLPGREKLNGYEVFSLVQY
ncbi:adenine phosphoribosyltransferase [Effusibacillus lacus]|uniref:Adenine phosphoribosyltransferase n=1 Tax=Effusibacillus lacus TaxID=1348429 RepID=A0A292YSK9_9BACL|nr:adenine phosphoribosyltransferase [Effusibacillus lacus]TCS68975.1 adenine phosphoribosyltransferase [Effusibacillus lacus]GAX91460.1 adenine phosphoribosyltransferase [Effusibacillus lacus]